jgi:TolB-like protein
MTAKAIDRFRRIEVLFDAALEYPPGPERDAWLLDGCATDVDLLADVRQLLEDHEHVSAIVPLPPEALPQFGPWQAIRLLGRGGMGMVYLAERADGAFRMTAAVKVVPLALASLDIEERFRRERQFLASLEHPKIARLIDGGVTGAGLPYLVMEFVDGLAIDRFCDAQQLDARSRIGLMRQVLEALRYVHGRQVIHRDLKPSNILVDAAGNAKLLDFGTARLVDASGDTAITKSGVFAFTPECASPEQVQGKPLTFASDIYSAGVLLYRLLTGRPPYRLADHSAAAVANTISHTEPEPSGLDAPLDAILSKALRKNPEERYASAEEMDADLARYLEGEPVRARRPRKLGWMAAAVAAIVLCAAAGWFFSHRKPAPQPHVSIAVLPFSDANGDSANQYFVDGLTEEFTSELARLKTLRVTSRSAAVLFRKQPRNLRDIGRQLKASHLLEASVERSGERMKIVASLERASDGARLWTNTYQRPTADIGAIEADLEAGIVATLGVAAPAPRKKHVPNEQAHRYYLKARFEENQTTVAANALARQDSRRAFELDPAYAAAYWSLGNSIWNRNNIAGEPMVQAELRESEQLWQKAIQLDPDFSSAHASLGLFAMYCDWDWNRAEREFQTALAAGQSAGAESGLANLYQNLGRRTEAVEHMLRGRDLDPVSPGATYNFVQFLAFDGRFAEWREEAAKLVDLSPTSVGWKISLNNADAHLGRTGQAIRNLRKLPQSQPIVRVMLARAEGIAGNREEALRILRPLESDARAGHIPMYWIASTYGAMNDEPNAVKWLERSIDLREILAIRIHVDFDFATMQNTPDFHRLKKRMGLDW